MQLSREVYQLVVRNTPTRTDLITLCSVSKAFQQEAERALYNTLHLRGPSRIMQVFRLLSTTPRLSRLVEALSVFVMEEAAEQEDEDEEEGEDEDEEQGALCPLPSDFWDVVASALREVKKLRFLSVHFEQIQDTAQAWVLGGCQFQLRTFHCDFEWDHALATFLHTQTDIVDLYLTDYRKDVKLDLPPSCITRSPAMSKLSMLECTFSEAAAALVPGRPVTRVKTCFSRIDEDEKRAELEDLLAKLRMSRRPLRAMDLGDESYDEDFTLLLLTCMGGTFSRFSELRYLGTLVLPVDGKKRVEFYGRLMRFPKLRCVELEVSEWEPPPMTPAALRALTYELRIYCPSISRVVFVYEFDRALMEVEPDGACALDPDAITDTLWREA